MADLLLLYRACGAECREDYLRELAHDNGLPLAEVQRAADLFGSSKEFGELVGWCKGGRLQYPPGKKERGSHTNDGPIE